MNKWLYFAGGLLAGIILTIVISFAINRYNSSPSQANEDNKTEEGANEGRNKPEGVTFFDEPGDVINESHFSVIQVIADDAALVIGETSEGAFLGTVFAITNGDGKYYYDNEQINVPKGKVVRQIGIYKYPTKKDMIKTVPIITIMDK